MRLYRWTEMSLRELVHRRAVAADVDEEMRFHLAMQTEQNLRAGLSSQDAHRDALLAFGGVLRHQEDMRDGRPARHLERVGHDVRFALRLLRKTPGFTTAAVLTLAVGIGGFAAVFSAVNDLLLHPLPYPSADRLVTIAHTTKGGGLPANLPVSSATYVAYAPAHSFAAMALYETGRTTLTGGDLPERLPVARVTQSLFAVLGISPILGRAFTPEEDRPGALNVVVMSDGLWRRRFGGDSGIIGRTVQLDGRPCVVVGVMPSGFAFPSEKEQLWLPMQLDMSDLGGFHTPAIGRLRNEVRPDEAQRELTALLPRVSTIVDYLSPETLANAGIRPDVHPYVQDVVVSSVRRALWTLWATVALVLLIACVNVASLLAVRAEARRQEMALRSALGAQRGHLMAQSVTESTVLVVLGGALGVALAYGALILLRRLGSDVVPRSREVHIDGVVLAVTALLAAAAAMLFGLVPLMRHRGDAASRALGSGTRGGTTDAGGMRARHVLVVAQVAMAAMLLVACGLMIRTAQNLTNVDIGFQPTGVLTFRIALPDASYPTVTDVAHLHSELLERIRNLPGVIAAGATSDLPLTGAPGDPLRTDRVTPGAKTLPSAVEMRLATRGYFEAMGIRVLAGRELRDNDIEPPSAVAVVTGAVVRRALGGRDPIGAQVAHGLAGVKGERPWSSVVGVVGDVRGVSLEEEPIGAVYYPMVTAPGIQMDWLARSMAYAVRVRSQPMSLLPTIRAVVHELDPALPVADPRTMQVIVERASGKARFTMMGLTLAAGAGLPLGSIGLYGMLAFATAQRTREIGVRIALGARPNAMRAYVLRQGLRLCLAGLALGFVAALALRVAIRPMLYQVSATDPLTFILVAVVLLVVGTAAAWIPARRAARLDPMRALRLE